MMEETKKTWNEKEPILKIENMSIRFTQYDRGMHQTELPVIRNLDVEVRQGEMVAVVGARLAAAGDEGAAVRATSGPARRPGLPHLMSRSDLM